MVRVARGLGWAYDGTPGYLDNVAFVVGTHGYLDNGIGLGRAGLFFAGASIVFIACGFSSSGYGYLDRGGFGSPTHGYLDCGGCVAFGEPRGRT